MVKTEFVRKHEGTIIDVFNKWVTRSFTRTALLEKKGNDWTKVTWREFGNHVADIAYGLQALGIEKGDTVAIFSENRVEWTYTDLAVLSLGAVSVPIYASSSAEQVRYILDHSGARVIFVNTVEMSEKVAQVREQLPRLEKVVIFAPAQDGKGYDLTLEELYRLGTDRREELDGSLKKLCGNVTPDDLATIMYTAGTTGPPKGCMITHDNILYICQSIAHIGSLRKDDLVLSFLPLAHAMERNGGQFVSIYFGLTTAYSPDMQAVPGDLRAVRPTFSRAVPHFFEKMYNRFQAEMNTYSPARRARFKRALETGKIYQQLKQEGKPVPAGLRVRRALANLMVYRKVKRLMGGRMRAFITGAAPLAKVIIEFFSAMGVLILEGYGMTESTVLVSVNYENHYRFGTVGLPIPGAEVKTAPDGEILIRHDGVMKGYYRDEESTREIIDDEGWLHSGDIGYFDDDGFLVITDRKKDLIITAGGKNIAPQNIENVLKTHPLISQVMVYGDRKPYLVALITLDEKTLPEQAERFGIKLDPGTPHSQNMEIRSVIENFITEKNWAFARSEMIKKFAILDEDFSQDTGEITPTQRVKRNIITGRYMEQIEQLYAEGDLEEEYA